MLSLMNKALLRFLKYSSVGISTFWLDLALLFVFVEKMKWPYLWATGGAFLIAVSLNYFISRKYVFKETSRSMHAGYIRFISMAILGVILVAWGMKICVGLLGWNYLISRILIAAIVGMWNYLFNLFINFQVVGKH